MKKYSIGEAAKITGISSKNIRFYEEKKVISPALREDNGYRYFTEGNIEEMKVIKNARELGLSLVEIKRLMVGCVDHDCEHTVEENKKVIDDYIKMISERLKQMQELKRRMVVLQKNGPYCCEVLHQLVISK